MAELYIEYEYAIAAFQLICAMLGMGATLTLDDFKDLAREPKAVFTGTCIQFLLPPLLAYFFITALALNIGVAIGLALIAAIPGGTTSNVFTHFAKGNVPLSISITGVTTIACLFFTPFILGLLIIDYLPEDFVMPTARIISDISFTLLLPLIIGMLLHKYLSQIAQVLSAWFIRASLVGILLIVIGSASAGRLDIAAFGQDNLVIVLAFIISLWALTALITEVLKLKKADKTAIEIEVVVRNINLAVLIKVSLFPAALGVNQSIGDMVLFCALLFGGVQMLIAFFIISFRRKTTKSVVV
ncbi:bile acid:sodium symporter family protein [Thalassotalea sp. LPB0316]|uniref:bile acid:sodium symporter family protein n=1 Tax=Thalassotalea sp. LPB0316 TaxID=2769490 RepID=UPI0018668B92|nr:bile acid:sodium symporter family protein [Thalassotalea sp. LPB0316]QOL24385.1 bile acid:sodium symporter family protein [Thalassotalea sp. LPB0316]